MPSTNEFDREQRRLKFLADRAMQRRQAIKRLSNRMIERRSVVAERMDVIYKLLKELDMPLSSKEIGQLLGLPRHMVHGSMGALDMLVAEGKVGYHGNSNARVYYADPDLGPSLIQYAKHEK